MPENNQSIRNNAPEGVFMNKEEYVRELHSFEMDIKLRKASGDKLCYMYYQFPNVLKEYPELKQDVFNVWDKAIESPKNSRYSIEDTYSSLKDAILNDKSVVPNAFNIYQKALSSKENDFDALRHAMETFEVMAQANPVFASRAAVAVTKAIDAYEDSITPKTPLKKFLHYMNDIGGRDEYIKNTLQEMRKATKAFLPNSAKGKDAAGYTYNS